MANTNAPFAGYDTSWGNKKAWQGAHFGPASYTTGGETLSASTFGWGGFELVLAANHGGATVDSIPMIVPLSISQNYFVGITFSTSASGAQASVTIKWYVTSTGAEVANATNLSAEKVRLLAIGV
jgi:hypothetical protein